MSAVPSIPSLWTYTDDIYDTPAERYLYGRLGDIDIVHVPTYSLRWMPRDQCPMWKGSKTRICPAGAAGLLVAGYFPTDEQYLVNGSYWNPPAAIELEALRDCGRRINPRWRRTFGSRRGCAVEVWCQDGGERGNVVLAEGIISALAAAQLHGSPTYCQALAAGSAENLRTLKLPEHRSYIFAADGDDAGRKVALALCLSVPNITIIYSRDGQDSADELR